MNLLERGWRGLDWKCRYRVIAESGSHNSKGKFYALKVLIGGIKENQGRRGEAAHPAAVVACGSGRGFGRRFSAGGAFPFVDSFPQVAKK
jgi:hypothetical protein